MKHNLFSHSVNKAKRNRAARGRNSARKPRTKSKKLYYFDPDKALASLFLALEPANCLTDRPDPELVRKIDALESWWLTPVKRKS